jgi:hypothetical protein
VSSSINPYRLDGSYSQDIPAGLASQLSNQRVAAAPSGGPFDSPGRGFRHGSHYVAPLLHYAAPVLASPLTFIEASETSLTGGLALGGGIYSSVVIVRALSTTAVFERLRGTGRYQAETTYHTAPDSSQRPYAFLFPPNR